MPNLTYTDPFLGRLVTDDRGASRYKLCRVYCRVVQGLARQISCVACISQSVLSHRKAVRMMFTAQKLKNRTRKNLTPL